MGDFDPLVEAHLEKVRFELWAQHIAEKEDIHELIWQGLKSYPLSRRARLWAQELARTGFLERSGLRFEVDTTSPAMPKQGEKTYDPELERRREVVIPYDPSPEARRKRHEALLNSLVPVRLEESQRVVWLNLYGDVTTKGYRNIEVWDKPLVTDVALIAALTAREGSRVGRFDKLPRPVRTRLEAFLSQTNRRSLHEVIEELKGEFSTQSNPKLLFSVESLEYPMGLLRERRPNFDNLPYEEQLALLKGTCERIYAFSEALRKLVSFMDFGAFDPEKQKAYLRTRTMQNADRYIKAALLRDVEGLSHREIANELNIPIPPVDHPKRDIEAVRDAYQEGREIMKRALGEEGWRWHLETLKAEKARWDSLNAEEQEMD